MRSIFCGNLEFEVRQSSVERLFKRFGKVEKVQLKSGYAFVHMEDERDAENAIRKLDGMDFGRKGQQLRVEWTRFNLQHERVAERRPDNFKRFVTTSSRPSKTLFVINFDPVNTTVMDIERHFEQYGKVSNVRIRRNFAFVQYELLHDAARALEATHMSKLLDHTIFVEYGNMDNDDRRNGYSRCSPSPYHRDRGGPDYARWFDPNLRNEQKGGPDQFHQPIPSSSFSSWGNPPAPNPRNEQRGSPYRFHEPKPNSIFDCCGDGSNNARDGRSEDTYLSDRRSPPLENPLLNLEGGKTPAS